MTWKPILEPGREPIYLRLMNALERDLRSGELKPGERLPPHRDLAYNLSIGVGTVMRAYEEAMRRGLVNSQVGRGTLDL